MSDLSVICLAAGLGRRIGCPKALLTLPDGRTFLQAVVGAVQAAGSDDVVVVVGPWWRGDGPPRARFVVNNDPDRGQISSVRLGIEVIAPGRAVMLCLVDQPLIRPATFAEVARVYRASPSRIVTASYKGRKGHPVVFPPQMVQELLGPQADQGARAVVYAHPELLSVVECDDPHVVRDVDEPKDIELLRSSWTAESSKDMLADEAPRDAGRSGCP